eukprot:5973050-Pyramimonas_sp.AAC.1
MLVVFLAEGDHPADVSAVPARKPSSIRPLSMGCADCKLVATAIARPISLLSQRSTLYSQTGGVSGRSYWITSLSVKEMGSALTLRGKTKQSSSLLIFAPLFRI